jgi:hypothetical protein
LVSRTTTYCNQSGADFAEIVDPEDPPLHPGVLVVHDREDGTDLPIATIVRAVANIATTYDSTQGMMLDVNQHVW